MKILDLKKIKELRDKHKLRITQICILTGVLRAKYLESGKTVKFNLENFFRVGRIIDRR